MSSSTFRLSLIGSVGPGPRLFYRPAWPIDRHLRSHRKPAPRPMPSSVSVPGSGAPLKPPLPLSTLHVSEMVLVSMVTSPFRARALPHRIVASVLIKMLVSATIFPAKAVPVLSVAELPTCQYTPLPAPAFLTTTEELDAVVRPEPIWKMKSAFGVVPKSDRKSTV